MGAVWQDLVSKNGTENKFTYYRGSVRDTYSPPWSLPGFELSLPNCWLLMNKRHSFATTKNTNLQRLVMKNVFRRRHHITPPAAITQMMASWDRYHVISWRVHLREFAQYGERCDSVFRSVTSFVCGKIGGNTTFYFEKEDVNLGHTGNIPPFFLLLQTNLH